MITWRWLPHVIVLLCAAVLSAAVAYVAWRRRATPGGRTLAWFALAVAEWTFAVAVEPAVVDPATKVLWSQIEYLGFVNVPPLLLLFALEYGQLSRPVTRRLISWLWLMPVVTLVLVWTNGWHGWVWSGFSPNTFSNKLHSLPETTGWLRPMIVLGTLQMEIGHFAFDDARIGAPFAFRQGLIGNVL
jgi:hypothetical protein